MSRFLLTVTPHDHIDRLIPHLPLANLHHVRSGRSLVRIFRSVRFCGPPPEPDVRLSPHPALPGSHVGRVILMLRLATAKEFVFPGSGSGWCPHPSGTRSLRRLWATIGRRSSGGAGPSS